MTTERSQTLQKIVVSSVGPSLTDHLDPRFGRCAYFLLVDDVAGSVEAFPNAARALGNGAGIQAAQDVVGMGAQAVITGEIGPNAHRVLMAAGIAVYIGGIDRCEAALKAFREGRLREVRSPTSPGFHGRGGGMGRRGQMGGR